MHLVQDRWIAGSDLEALQDAVSRSRDRVGGLPDHRLTAHMSKCPVVSVDPQDTDVFSIHRDDFNIDLDLRYDDDPRPARRPFEPSGIRTDYSILRRSSAVDAHENDAATRVGESCDLPGESVSFNRSQLELKRLIFVLSRKGPDFVS